jgi:nucleoside-diphosphate-sugar epimerase
MTVVLVTGASGFVGGAVCRFLAGEDGYTVRAAIRRPCVGLPRNVSQVQVQDLSATTRWDEALRGAAIVVHAAARVHVMRETVVNPLSEFRRVNVEGTLSLARQAAEAGVRRFVFISSIKALGESTTGRIPFQADEQPAPVDPYGISKLEAELALRELAAASGLELVIVRPVLVYGPGVRGNFQSMLRWLRRGIPLPLGAIRNSRSVVGLDNLVDFVSCTLAHPAAANEAFLVSDGEDISTTELLRRAADALGVRALLVPVPPPALAVIAAVLGRALAAERLLGSLQVDITKNRDLLGWIPRVSLREGLRRTVSGLAHQK